MRPLFLFRILLASGLSCVALDAGDSKALLFIDINAPTANSVTIRLSGTFNRSNAGTGTFSTHNNTFVNNQAGISPITDMLRFSALPVGTTINIPGQRFAFTNNPRNTNPFTGLLNNTMAASVSDTNFNNNTGPYFTFAFGTSGQAGATEGTFYLSNNYSNNTSIDRTLTFNNLTPTDIGLLPGFYSITYDLGTEQVIIRVPGPLPILGAATAFGFSRRLRKRIHSRSK